MTPHEKAVDAINVRLERLQANLREAQGEARGALFPLASALLSLAERKRLHSCRVYIFSEDARLLGTQ